MRLFDEFINANIEYAKTHPTEELAGPPVKKVAVLTCMDARLDPAKILGLRAGDAHVIRNAGGRASEDAVRSLVISQVMLGTQAIVVIHHTDCGMVRFSNDELWDRVEHHYGVDASDMDFLPFDEVGPSVVEDVRILREHPLIPDTVPIRGYVWNVRTGFLEEVPEAHVN